MCRMRNSSLTSSDVPIGSAKDRSCSRRQYTSMRSRTLIATGIVAAVIVTAASTKLAYAAQHTSRHEGTTYLLPPACTPSQNQTPGLRPPKQGDSLSPRSWVGNFTSTGHFALQSPIGTLSGAAPTRFLVQDFLSLTQSQSVRITGQTDYGAVGFGLELTDVSGARLDAVTVYLPSGSADAVVGRTVSFSQPLRFLSLPVSTTDSVSATDGIHEVSITRSGLTTWAFRVRPIPSTKADVAALTFASVLSTNSAIPPWNEIGIGFLASSSTTSTKGCALLDRVGG